MNPRTLLMTLAACAAPALAEPVMYQFEGVASGAFVSSIWFADDEFTDRAFTIRVFADTDDIFQFGNTSGFFQTVTSQHATVAIEGFGTYDILSPSSTFSVTSNNSIGDDSVPVLWSAAFTFNTPGWSLSAYRYTDVPISALPPLVGLAGNFGPETRDGEFVNRYADPFPATTFTSGGELVFLDAQLPITLTVIVPAPATLLLVVAPLLASLRRATRPSQQPR